MRAEIPDECVEIVDSNNAQIYSNLPPSCIACLTSCSSGSELCAASDGSKRRRGKFSSAAGTTFLCTNDEDSINSSKIFKKYLQLHQLLIGRVSSIREEVARREASKTNRLFHNLVSLNAHAIQDFYTTVPQEELASSGSHALQKKLIKTRLSADPDAAAVLFLRALKNETAVKAELSVYRKLHDPSPVIRPQTHPLHKVLLNVVNLFFQDLADNEVRASIESTDVHLFVDYEALQVALYHLMDNACKYVRPNSEIKISVTTSASRVCIILDMYSFFLEAKERALVFDDDYSGKQARTSGKAGKGLGMRLIKDLLQLNEGSISITWGELESTIGPTPKGEPAYARNSFVVSFPISVARQMGRGR